MKTIKEYILENYEIDNIKDIADHGCATGCAGTLIYYNHTTAFHDIHEQEIWDLVFESAENEGITSLEFIASLQGQQHVGSMEQLKNLLVWFAVEQRCFDIINDNNKKE